MSTVTASVALLIAGASKGGKKLEEIDKVFPFWPDNEVVRNDMLDYAFEIEHFDSVVLDAPLGSADLLRLPTLTPVVRFGPFEPQHAMSSFGVPGGEDEVFSAVAIDVRDLDGPRRQRAQHQPVQVRLQRRAHLAAQGQHLLALAGDAIATFAPGTNDYR